ncbi:MAG: cupin domain-containing protein [Burkholderiales bacterium]|nr:cupin domain-containing protein [Burkholderiales bacterium]
MKRLVSSVAVVVATLAVVGLVSQSAFSAGEGKKEPVRFKVLNTFKPQLAGVDKAQLIQFEMDPGAEVKSFKVGSSEILWVTRGVFTYKYGDKTVQRKQGESWLQEAGVVLDVANRSKSGAVLQGVQFIKAK